MKSWLTCAVIGGTSVHEWTEQKQRKLHKKYHSVCVNVFYFATNDRSDIATCADGVTNPVDLGRTPDIEHEHKSERERERERASEGERESERRRKTSQGKKRLQDSYLAVSQSESVACH